MVDRLASLRAGISVSNYTEQAFDLEAGIDDESSKLLKEFNKEVDAIENIISWANKRIDANYSSDKDTRTKQLEAVEEKVVTVRRKLKSMADENKTFARKQSHRPATVRTRIVRYTKCTNDFIAMTGSLSSAWEEHQRELEAHVKRNVMNLNPELNESAVDIAIGSGEQQQLQRMLSAPSDTIAERQQLEEIRMRNRELQKLVKGVAELNQTMQDMSILVAVQQDLINQVEYIQEEVIEEHKQANDELDVAHNYQKSARKKRFWCIVLLLLIILVFVLAIVLSIVL